MKKTNYYKLIGISFVAYFTGMCAGDIGEMSGDPIMYTWDMPIVMGVFTGTLFLMGYFAGKEDYK